jgi:CDP-6-deoxy-D-xylo-4-hexulose-3-dehydrase
MNWENKAKKFSGLNISNENLESKELRSKIVELSVEYFHKHHNKKKFIPGESFISASGKYLTEHDLVNLVDSSLDLWLTSGRFADKFEKKLALCFGSKFAAPTVSGSAANLLAFTALTSDFFGKKKIVDGDEVITVAAGFPTTVAPIIHNRCIPVYLDVDLKTANIETSLLQKAISKKTKAVMLAHTLGNPFDLEVVQKFCQENELYLVEDCCDAFGSNFDSKPVGSFGIFSTLSFYAAHHITTGEGGAVMYNDVKLKRIIESYRDWGRDCWCLTGMNNTCNKRYDWELGKLPKGYDHKFIFSHVGFNLKMTDMQAAIGLSQLDKVDYFIKKRKKNFYYLKNKFIEEELGKYFILPESHQKSDPSWYGFLITIKDNKLFTRNEIVKFLNEKRIITRLLFAGNLTKQPGYMSKNSRIIGDLKNTDKFMNDSFWIGVWPGLDKEHLDYMLNSIKDFISKTKK